MNIKCKLCDQPLKSSTYSITKEYSCQYPNHSYLLIYQNNSPILLRFSQNYKIFIEINYIENTSKITDYSNNFSLTLNYIISPDFPTLTKLNEKINIISTFY